MTQNHTQDGTVDIDTDDLPELDDQDPDRIPLAAPDVSMRAKESVVRVLQEGRLAAGREVNAFETVFADVHGVEHAVATANGTTALHAALEALGIGPGDRVVTTPFSFVATANVVRLAGADVIFADVDPGTLNLDPDAVEAIVADREVDAIMPVHLFGHPAQMHRFQEIADQYDCLLIEDAAQAHGATIDGDPVGAFSDAACFSFYPTKTMTTGEGGMVLTPHEDVAERTRRFVDHGRTGRGSHAQVGHNFRMTNVEAAIGLEQIDRVKSFVETRQQHANVLSQLLGPTDVEVPTVREDVGHAFTLYTIRTADREGLREYLADRNVDTGVYYDTPIHHEPAYEHVDSVHPVAELASEEVVSLPVHPMLSKTQVLRVATEVRNYVQ